MVEAGSTGSQTVQETG